MGEAIKPTPGPLRVQADDKWPFYIRTFDAAGDCVFREDMPAYSTAQRCLAECLAGKHMGGDAETSVRANIAALVDAELRAEAHNVLTDTGLRPRQLVERVKELKGVLQEAVDCGMVPTSSAKDGGASKYSRQVHVADRIRAALSKSLPNTVVETPK
jgi:hypothetical protein